MGGRTLDILEHRDRLVTIGPLKEPREIPGSVRRHPMNGETLGESREHPLEVRRR